MMLTNKKWISRSSCFCVLLCAAIGCVQEKDSLHELDHELPPHWPVSMSDAATKIEERLALDDPSPSRSDARSELVDLVSWIPEIAADTDLTEAEWLPIYKLCETLRRHLAAGEVGIEEIRSDFMRLQAMLRDSELKIAGLGAGGTSNEEQLISAPGDH